jgi:nucleoid-associated protein YgaU
MEPNPFPINSRYHRVETAKLEVPDGTSKNLDLTTIVYLKRRFVPSPENFHLIQEHTVTQGDRLDNIAAKYLGDPEQFWRLCDANNALRPEELTQQIGRKLKITLPEGISGPAT